MFVRILVCIYLCALWKGALFVQMGAHDVIKWPGDKANSSGNEEMLQIKITKPINWTVA